jgi:hypothetical protein
MRSSLSWRSSHGVLSVRKAWAFSTMATARPLLSARTPRKTAEA